MTMASPEDTNTYYVPPVGGLSTPSANFQELAGGGDVFAPASCTVSAFHLRAIEADSALTSSSLDDTSTFTVRQNGGDTSMTCSVRTTAYNLPEVCSDTDPSHKFTVTAGDLIEFKYTQTNGYPEVTYSTELICD